MTDNTAKSMGELIERLEAATGPDQGLFGAAYEAVFPGRYTINRSGHHFDEWKRFQALMQIGAWLDAAMTLVPDGMIAEVVRLPDGSGEGSLRFPYDDKEHFSRGATPAIALCIAALKARSTRD